VQTVTFTDPITVRHRKSFNSLTAAPSKRNAWHKKRSEKNGNTELFAIIMEHPSPKLYFCVCKLGDFSGALDYWISVHFYQN
jgi:hypothetical protein